ncbi:hypothetical protein AALP_AAs58725U000100 [Arabis alpina]|uniref:Uncharacterized protein n=1 Tax=Arabis alpina TaxID=50452 RepID=A0A087FYV7_ARAAL|nr:hypothetical protein AALP_AAs58725U000100 [Arabis alpina]
MFLFVSSQVGLAEAKHHQRNKLLLDCVPLAPPPPRHVAPPIYVPPSRSRRGRGP